MARIYIRNVPSLKSRRKKERKRLREKPKFRGIYLETVKEKIQANTGYRIHKMKMNASKEIGEDYDIPLGNCSDSIADVLYGNNLCS